MKYAILILLLAVNLQAESFCHDKYKWLAKPSPSSFIEEITPGQFRDFDFTSAEYKSNVIKFAQSLETASDSELAFVAFKFAERASTTTSTELGSMIAKIIREKEVSAQTIERAIVRIKNSGWRTRYELDYAFDGNASLGSALYYGLK